MYLPYKDNKLFGSVFRIESNICSADDISPAISWIHPETGIGSLAYDKIWLASLILLNINAVCADWEIQNWFEILTCFFISLCSSFTFWWSILDPLLIIQYWEIESKSNKSSLNSISDISFNSSSVWPRIPSDKDFQICKKRSLFTLVNASEQINWTCP